MMKLTYSENNNSMVYSRFRPTNQHMQLSNGGLDKQDALNNYPLCGLLSVVFTEIQNLKETEGMCLLTISSRTEESFAKQQFAQRLSSNRGGGYCPP